MMDVPWLCLSDLTNGPWNKTLNLIFPAEYVIPKNLKFSHGPSKSLDIYQCITKQKGVKFLSTVRHTGNTARTKLSCSTGLLFGQLVDLRFATAVISRDPGENNLKPFVIEDVQNKNSHDPPPPKKKALARIQCGFWNKGDFQKNN